jgi:hypothetical protein
MFRLGGLCDEPRRLDPRRAAARCSPPAAAAITGLYLLRMRRRQLVVPFAALWRRSPARATPAGCGASSGASSRGCCRSACSRCCASPSATRAPRSWLREPVTLAIVLDRSASMGGARSDATGPQPPPTSDQPQPPEPQNSPRGPPASTSPSAAPAPSSLALGPVDRALVIAAGPEVAVPGPLSRDAEPLLSGLDGLTAPSPARPTSAAPSPSPAAPSPASPAAKILVLTDGALDPAGPPTPSPPARPTRGPVPPILSPRTCPKMQTAVPGDQPDDPHAAAARDRRPPVRPDVAITAFAARRYPEDREHIEVLAEVHNLGDAPPRSSSRSPPTASASAAAAHPRPRRAPAEVLRDLDAARTRLLAQLSPGPGSIPPRSAPPATTGPTRSSPRCAPSTSPSSPTAPTSSSRPPCSPLQDHIQLTGVGPAPVPAPRGRARPTSSSSTSAPSPCRPAPGPTTS